MNDDEAEESAIDSHKRGHEVLLVEVHRYWRDSAYPMDFNPACDPDDPLLESPDA